MSIFSTNNSRVLFSSKTINSQSLSGGITGSIPYQLSTNKTAFLNPDLNGDNKFLQLYNGLPSWSSDVVTLNTDQTIQGNKTFTNKISYDTNSYKSSDLTSQYNLVPKIYVDKDYDDIPPSVQFGSIYNTSSDIYIPIIYPTQIYRGTCPQPIPTILGCVFKIYLIDTANNNEILIKTIDSTSTKFDPNYVLPLSTDPSYKLNMNPLTGIVISKTKETSITPSKTDFYTNAYNSSQQQCFIYKITDAMIGSKQIKITGNYVNYVNGSELVSKDSITYSEGYAPSNISIVTATNTDNYSATININNPTYTNYNPSIGDNDNPSITITKFTYGYSTPGSPYRYNDKLSQSILSQEILNPGTQSPFQLSLSNLYPESPYTFSINSTNSINKSSTGVTFSDLFTTTYLAPAINNTNISNATINLQNTTMLAYDLSNNLQNVLNNSSGSSIVLTFINSTPLSINYDYTSRGKIPLLQTTKLMTLQASIKTYSVTASFQSFPIGSQVTSTNSNSNLTITSGAIEDQYTENYKQGFYSKVPSFTVTMPSTLLSSGKNTLTINQKYYNINGNEVATLDKLHDIHYDNLSVNPSFGPITFALNLGIIDNYMTQVSGIWILRTTPSISVSAVVNNLYNNYYFNGNILTYSFTNGCLDTQYETNLTNYTSSTKTFSRTLNPPIVSAFKYQIYLNLRATNLIGIANSTQQKIDIICDTLSYTLITDTTKNPILIQTVTSFNAEQSGFRVWTNPGSTIVLSNGSTTYIPSDYGSSTNTISYSASSNAYSHSNDLSSGNYIQELQIANGRYRSGTNSNNSYLNYTNYKKDDSSNNTLNYLNVPKTETDYRFSTFVWKYNGTLTSTISYFVFTFKNFSPGTVLKQDLITDSYYFNSDNRFFLHYRLEDDKSIAPTTSTSTISYSTIWVDGNSKFGTTYNTTTPVLNTDIPKITGNNYNTISNIVRAPTSISYAIVGQDLVATVSSILYGPISTSFKVYCRFGLPMNNNYSFEYVTLKFIQ